MGGSSPVLLIWARWRRDRKYQLDEQPIRVVHHLWLQERHQPFAHRTHPGHRLFNTGWMRRGRDKANSYGAGFAQAGGVYAAQLDVSGVLERESYPGDLMSRKTFRLQRLHLLSTRRPGDHLVLRTLAQPAITMNSLHLNSSCSQQLYAVIGLEYPGSTTPLATLEQTLA